MGVGGPAGCAASLTGIGSIVGSNCLFKLVYSWWVAMQVVTAANFVVFCSLTPEESNGRLDVGVS